jgi:hypothetical protein
MLELVYNYEHNAWTMHGMGAVLDPATGALNTSEYGRRASCACVFEYDDLTTGLAWGDEHGYVNELAPHNMDARMIGYLSPVAGNTYRLDYDPGASNGGADKCLVGASILITDDRTTAERAAGTFTDMRYSGNVRSISAYASNVLTVSGGGVGETYQDGAQVWIYWPIRSRIVTEAFTDDPASVKRLQKIMPRYRGRSSAAIAVKYQGNDDRFYPDDVLIKQAWQASSSNSGWFDNYMSMMRNNDSYGPQRSAFASANQYDMTVFCRTGDNLGRKFMLVFEEFSIEDFELYGWMLTHQVMGERGYLSKVKAP